MLLENMDIEIISAPSILGLKPSGVEKLGESLLVSGLANKLRLKYPVVHVPTLNSLYNELREQESNCLNAKAIRDFSLTLNKEVVTSQKNKKFSFVLGGDCSVLIGIMVALKSMGNYGLIFLDAHADFYEPERSISGEVADMDLAIVTGRGPELLKNINNLQPYVKDEYVVHLGQRDWEETQEYGSQDIRETTIKCLNLNEIKKSGIHNTRIEVLQYINKLKVDGFWMHFDTDVLSDEINPAVDYRLPGGLKFNQVEYIIKSLLSTGLTVGMSVTIFNPTLDKNGQISKDISESLGKAFNFDNL